MLELGVRIRIRVRVRDVKGTKRLSTKGLGYDMRRSRQIM